jgi:hypothetical protein
MKIRMDQGASAEPERSDGRDESQGGAADSPNRHAEGSCPVSGHAPPLLYHATPLHYLPHILAAGALYSQSVLAARGFAPRASAKRRDRMLGLTDYVRLSLEPRTPLLADKLARGFAHAILVFDGPSVLALPEVGVIPYNTKAWRMKAAYEPVVDPVEKERLLRGHAARRRFASLEVLVKYGLPLTALCAIGFFADEEREAVRCLVSDLGIDRETPYRFDGVGGLSIGYTPVTLPSVLAYFEACRSAGRLLAPPDIPFD